LIRMKTIVGVHVLTGYGAIATHVTRLTSRSEGPKKATRG
jgi:hypothetical protein